MINENETRLDYDVIKTIFYSSKIPDIQSPEKDYIFEFISEIKNQIKCQLENTNTIDDKNEKLAELFGGYPINYQKFYKDLN